MRAFFVALFVCAYSVACTVGVRKAPLGGVAFTNAAAMIPAALASKPTVRMVLIGDTGEDNGDRAVVLNSVAKTAADLVVVLGDLVYPEGPSCSSGELSAQASAILDKNIGTPFGSMGKPVLLVLGNHDVINTTFIPKTKFGFYKRPSVEQELCYYLYLKNKPGSPFVLPARHYGVTLGPATLSVVSSSHTFLDDSAAAMTRELFGKRTTDWNVLLTHHTYRTFDDKVDERQVKTWIDQYALTPEMVLNGHAHFLQMGSYDGILAVTSGAGAKERPQSSCAVQSSNPGNCRPGEYFGYAGKIGFVVLELTESTATFEFKDKEGAPLWACRSQKGSRTCEYFKQ